MLKKLTPAGTQHSKGIVLQGNLMILVLFNQLCKVNVGDVSYFHGVIFICVGMFKYMQNWVIM
jgi:hypothetical protein